MKYYSHKKFTIRVERAEEEGWLYSAYGDFLVKPNDLICTDETGNQFVLTDSYFNENYIPVKKIRNNKTKRKSPFEEGYIKSLIEFGSLPNQEEDKLYIAETLNLVQIKD